jgi:hypothetical protein
MRIMAQPNARRRCAGTSLSSYERAVKEPLRQSFWWLARAQLFHLKKSSAFRFGAVRGAI